MRFLAVVVVLSVAALSSALDCPTVQVQQIFDVVKYTGTWYEIARVPTEFEPDASCVTATYSLQDNPTYPVNVYNRQLNDASGSYQDIEGGARLADPNSTEGKLKVKFPVTPVEANYWVLETDYDNYSLVFSCNEYNGISTRTSWILSRSTELSSASRQKVVDAIARNNLDASLYVPTGQGEACQYLS